MFVNDFIILQLDYNINFTLETLHVSPYIKLPDGTITAYPI